MYWTVHMFGGPRRVNHAAAAIGDLIFTFGGYCSGGDYNHFKPIDTHMLDTIKLSWVKLELKQSLSNVPFQRYGHTAVAHGSKIYLWGGRNDRQVCNTLFCFNTETQMWSIPKVYGRKPVPRDGHSACVLNNCMYIFGGFQENPSHFSQNLCMLNLKTMIWSVITTQGTPPSYRDFHTATAIGDRMYIFGGRGDVNGPRHTDNEVYCDQIYYYDTITGTWVHSPVTGGLKPQGRRSHSAFTHNGFLYIFGGFNKNLDKHFQDIYRYDPLSSLWKAITPIGTAPCARRRQICVIIKDRIFISGGTSPSSKIQMPWRLIDEYNLFNAQLLEDHDDLHVLDLNPTLKDMSLVIASLFIKENGLNIEELEMPPTLINELCTISTVNTNASTPSYEEAFPSLEAFYRNSSSNE